MCPYTSNQYHLDFLYNYFKYKSLGTVYSQLCLSRIRISRRSIQVFFSLFSIVFDPT